MVAVPERDELLTARRDLRERHRRLVGLGAARGEERLAGLADLAGRELDELLGELDDPDRGVERRDVPEAIDLRVERGVHLRDAPGRATP